MARELASKLQRDAPVVGNWVSLPEPAIAELFASMDFDFVAVDTEHTSVTLDVVSESVRAIDAADGDAHSVVRVPGHDPDRIKRVLDTGTDGIMVPMVETASEAESIVEACRYPPDGIRGVGPGRGAGYGLTLRETVDADDDSFATIVQIESVEGVENAREIAAVDGIDALFVGPTDLSMSMGSLGTRGEQFSDRIDAVLDGAAAEGVPVGTIAVGADDVERWETAGFDFLFVGYDAHYLVEGSERARDAYESAASR